MRDKETITIPLNKVSYEDLEALTIEQQTQLFVKDKEIERLNKNKNDVIEFIERYLKLNLEVFDTKDLLDKILEIVKRGDYIDNN